MKTNLLTSLIVSTTLVLASMGTVVALPQVIAGQQPAQSAVIEWR
ncbi:hypothetical protein [Mariluticola halotolerans]|nr:hypothetical protein [Mariluticola halotolerans]